MSVLFRNNAVSRLAASLTTGATTLSVTAGDGALFPSPTAGDWFPLTLIKVDGSIEILRCNSRSGDVMTVVRAQEGTSALAFTSGDRVELRLTAAAINTVFGGSSATPTFGSLELVSATPTVDFHYGSSTADYTLRLAAVADNTLMIQSALGNLAQFSEGAFTSYKSIIASAGVFSLNGSLRARTGASGIYAEFGSNGGVATYDAAGTLLSTGIIWHTGNFSLASKVTGDNCSVAGFASSTPYMRRASDSGVFYLQTELGFTPVRQGGGSDQLSNALRIGWTAASRVSIQVDTTNLGYITTDDRVLPIIAAQPVGAVGTLSFFYTAVAATPGTLVAGGNLLYGYAAGQGGNAAAGTWKCMGDSPAGGRTLFMRVS